MRSAARADAFRSPVFATKFVDTSKRMMRLHCQVVVSAVSVLAEFPAVLTDGPVEYHCKDFVAPQVPVVDDLAAWPPMTGSQPEVSSLSC